MSNFTAGRDTISKYRPAPKARRFDVLDLYGVVALLAVWVLIIKILGDFL